MSKLIGTVRFNADSVGTGAGKHGSWQIGASVIGLDVKSLASSLATCEGFEDQDMAEILAAYLKEHSEPVSAVLVRVCDSACKILEFNDE